MFSLSLSQCPAYCLLSETSVWADLSFWSQAASRVRRTSPPTSITRCCQATPFPPSHSLSQPYSPLLLQHISTQFPPPTPPSLLRSTPLPTPPAHLSELQIFSEAERQHWQTSGKESFLIDIKLTYLLKVPRLVRVTYILFLCCRPRWS